jgi:glycosyltransferase involved in cell wall biosynthesis
VNIGIVIPGFSANEQDWCIPVYLNLVRQLAKNHYVRVFPIRYPFTDAPYEVYGAHVFPFGGGSHSARLKRWQILWQVERALERHHRSRPFDVLHAIWADETGHIVNRVGKQLGIPTVVSIAGGELVGFKTIQYGLQIGKVTRWLVHQAIKNAGHVVAPCLYSARMAQAYAEFHGIMDLQEGERLSIVPLGVDTDLFGPPANPQAQRPMEFLHVASLSPIKRQDVLLNLIAKMPSSQVHIVGEGRLQGYLQRLAEDLHISERVTFHGAVPHDQLPHFYQRAQYLLMTSQHEAYCMAALEAFACGMGIIGTGVGLIPELGMAAPFGDFDGFLRNIVGRHRTFTTEKLESQYTLVSLAYSLAHMVKGLETIYETVKPLQR